MLAPFNVFVKFMGGGGGGRGVGDVEVIYVFFSSFTAFRRGPA